METNLLCGESQLCVGFDKSKFLMFSPVYDSLAACVTVFGRACHCLACDSSYQTWLCHSVVLQHVCSRIIGSGKAQAFKWASRTELSAFPILSIPNKAATTKRERRWKGGVIVFGPMPDRSPWKWQVVEPV